MKPLFYLLFIFFIPAFTYSQARYDAIWAAAYSGQGNWRSSILLQFDTDSVRLDSFQPALELDVAYASICDTNGEFQMYSNGCRIHNGQNVLIPNGDTLNPGDVFEGECLPPFPMAFYEGYYISGTQSMMLIPSIENDSLFYLFHQGMIYEPILVTNKLYYTLVNTKTNDGLGQVIEKNVVIWDGYIEWGCMAAVKALGEDAWWILGGIDQSSSYYTLKLDATGISDTFTQTIGPFYLGEGGGQSKFSPDGSRFARFLMDTLTIFDFDRATGLLSNPITMSMNNGDYFYSGAEFSASGRFLYVANFDTLYQFDLESSDIFASKTNVAIWDGTLYYNFWPVCFGNMQIGPDCRIYYWTQSQPYINVINYPDNAGEACDVKQHYLHTSHLMGYGTPYYPNYRLDTEYPFCDSTIALPPPTITSLPVPDVGMLGIWPNPASNQVSISLPQALSNTNIALEFCDIIGRSCAVSYTMHGTSIEADVSSLSAGVYFCKLSDGKQHWVGKLAIFR